MATINPDLKRNAILTIDTSQVNTVDPTSEGGSTQEEVNANNYLKIDERIKSTEIINGVTSNIRRNENGNLLFELNGNSNTSLLEIKTNGSIANLNGQPLITTEDNGIITKKYVDDYLFYNKKNFASTSESINFNYFDSESNSITVGNVFRINTAKLESTPSIYAFLEINSTTGKIKAYSDPDATPFVGTEDNDIVTKKLLDDTVSILLSKIKEFNPNLNLEFLKNEKK